MTTHAIRDEDLFVMGFHPIFRKDRNKYGGDVAIYVSEDIKLENEMICLLTLNLFQLSLSSPV